MRHRSISPNQPSLVIGAGKYQSLCVKDSRGDGRPPTFTTSLVAGQVREYAAPMTTAAAGAPPGQPVSSDPASIRAALTPTLRGEFDREWDVVLDEAKESKDLGRVHNLLHKWRHIAAGEAEEPGRYYRVLAKAEQIIRAGGNPDAQPADDVMRLIAERIGQ